MTDGNLDRHEREIQALREEVNRMKVWKASSDIFWAQQHKWDQDVDDRVKALERMSGKVIGAGVVVLFLGNLVIQWAFRQFA